MTWTISIIVLHLVLGSGLWLYFHRRRIRQGWRQAGVVEVAGRVCGGDREQGVLWSDETLPRRPVVIQVCSEGQRRDVVLEDPRLDRGWGRPEVRVGDPVKIEAVWVAHGPQPPTYRTADGELTLEAMSVQLTRGLLVRRLTLAAAGVALLGLGLGLAPLFEVPPDKLAAMINEVQCPEMSKLQRVNLQQRGRLGFCLQRKSGVRHGPWLHLSMMGIKLVEGYYELGKKHRVWTVRAESGQALARGRYHLDQQHGRWRFWDSSGLEIRSATFVRGWPEPNPTSRL